MHLHHLIMGVTKNTLCHTCFGFVGLDFCEIKPSGGHFISIDKERNVYIVQNYKRKKKEKKQEVQSVCKKLES